MPCVKCKNGKWRMGSGKCRFRTKKLCEAAYEAYKAKKYGGKLRK